MPEEPIGLSFLPPELAKQLQIAAYICVGTVAVSVWDILNNVTVEYRLFTSTKFGFPAVAYLLARLTSLEYQVHSSRAYPLGRCGVAHRVIESFYPVALSSTCLLFFFRVRAVYARSRIVTAIFGVLWLAVLGTAMTIPFGGDAIPIGPTPYCLISATVAPYAGACATMASVYDTAIFIAISYRLVTNTYPVHTHKELLKALLSGAYLPSFSKSLFVDGQVYYMISVISMVVTLVVYANVSPVYPGFLALPNLMLTSAMACRVYRNTKLGLLRESGNMTLSLPVSDVSTAPITPLTFALFPSHKNPDQTGTAHTGILDIQAVGIPASEAKPLTLGDSGIGRSRHTATV
ncbi:hypothetical protein B0H17DRAFT_958693 [Mycena rosella]|uniref:Uncharacterized protein n=1 Tax=Mycena rosella TaxID=1033263 RepID=A0AAD7CHF8_MYCRO|nr:hypothetical protein B0H17DRAFT_958693 [Mycena rosella]